MAGEIKELAQQTAAATQDVKDKIASVQSSTNAAISDLEGIATVIHEVGGTMAETAAAMNRKADLTTGVAEQLAQAATGVTEANRGVAHSAEASRSIAADIAGVNVAVGQIRLGGEQVETNARDLLQLAGELTRMVEQFKLTAARELGAVPSSPHGKGSIGESGARLLRACAGTPPPGTAVNGRAMRVHDFLGLRLASGRRLPERLRTSRRERSRPPARRA